MPISCGDLRLAQPLEVPQVEQAALAVVEHAESGGEQRPLLAAFVAALEHVEVAIPLVVLGGCAGEGERCPDALRVEGGCDFSLRDAGAVGDLGDRRRARELRGQLGRARVEPGPDLLQAPRHPHRVGPVAEVALDLTGHVRDHERPELGSPRVEAVDRLDQPDAPDLHEVLVELSACAVPTGEALDERHVLLNQPLASSEVAVLVVLAEQDPRGFAGALRAAVGERRPGGCSGAAGALRMRRAPKGSEIASFSLVSFAVCPAPTIAIGITQSATRKNFD